MIKDEEGVVYADVQLLCYSNRPKAFLVGKLDGARSDAQWIQKSKCERDSNTRKWREALCEFSYVFTMPETYAKERGLL